MPTVHVNLGERSYDVICEYGILAQAGARILETGLQGRVAIITDSNVSPLYAAELEANLVAAGFEPSLHVAAAGEASKSMGNVEGLCREMAQAGHDRKSFVVALGGGVVGDLAGFVASVFYRGVPFVQIPTTIVSLVDSSVGGKTGVNIVEGKNLVGAFHQPKLVLADPATLKSLPPREYREGYAEVIKHAAIRDAEMIAELEALDPDDNQLPADLIARNIAIKARVVEEDEKETSGVRALLNFGHTVGHGIEASVPYGTLLHGEAVSLGTVAALNLSVQHGGLTQLASDRVLALLKRFQLPTVLPSDIDSEVVLEKLQRDKKFSAGEIKFVLLEALGSAFVSSVVSRGDLQGALKDLRG